MKGLISKDIPQENKQRNFGEFSITGFPKDDVEGSIPARFDKIVRSYPEQTAIKSWEIEYSYDQLNRITNQIARVIREQSESLEVPVAFLLGYGAMPITAIFGILKAGGFYLPLDPSFPSERLKYMLEDSGSRIIITNDKNLLAARELSQNKSKIINLDDLDRGKSDENLNLIISPDALACLHYTSGSTGQPKGVIQNHRNLLHTAWQAINSSGYNPDDNIALLHSTGFAASILPILGSLLNGAALYPFDLKNRLAKLGDWLKEEQITVFMAVPSLFRHLAMTLTEDDKFPRLRLITAGGEAVLKSDVDLYKKYFSHCQMRHGIGGTEMQSFRHFWIDKNTEILDNVVPVGYPMEDKDVLILDDTGNPVGFNEVGEIVIRSRYLSPGYWRQPDLTKEKFIDDPDHPGMRLYWTGDLGKLCEDLCLYHLGRKDFQVKIRGFRIELGAIESILMQHPKIYEAVVIVNEPPGFEKRLLAYFSVKQTQLPPTTEDLRVYLKKEFPDYMIPFAFVQLDELPHTPTGKIDRLRLPSLEEVFNLEKEFVPPRNDIERQLKIIWEDLFNITPIGIKNDFFQLGGHSLLAATMITRFEENFGKRLELSTFSESSTIEKLAKVISSDSVTYSKSPLIAIRANGTKPPLYCVHGIGGHILPFLQLADYVGLEQPVYGFQSILPEQPGNLEYSIETLAGDYIREIKNVQPKGPYFLTGFSFGGYVAYEIARQLRSQGDRIGVLAILDTHADSAPRYRQSLNFGEYVSYKFKSIFERVNFHYGNMAGYPLMEKYKYLQHRKEQPSAQEVILGDVEEDQIPDRMRGVMEANISALRHYIPGKYTGKIILFRSIDHGKGVYYGWNELTSGDVVIYDVPGKHRGILLEPNVPVLAKQLRKCIDENI
jgi:amino acid adenylation domain-containing protein